MGRQKQNEKHPRADGFSIQGLPDQATSLLGQSPNAAIPEPEPFLKADYFLSQFYVCTKKKLKCRHRKKRSKKKINPIALEERQKKANIQLFLDKISLFLNSAE